MDGNVKCKLIYIGPITQIFVGDKQYIFNEHLCSVINGFVFQRNKYLLKTWRKELVNVF